MSMQTLHSVLILINAFAADKLIPALWIVGGSSSHKRRQQRDITLASPNRPRTRFKGSQLVRMLNLGASRYHDNSCTAHSAAYQSLLVLSKTYYTSPTEREKYPTGRFISSFCSCRCIQPPHTSRLIVFTVHFAPWCGKMSTGGKTYFDLQISEGYNPLLMYLTRPRWMVFLELYA